MFSNKKSKHIIEKSLLKEYNKIRPKDATERFCHAPFHSLVFSTYGRIQACFYNKREALGIYPKESINEIWFGDKIKTLKKYLSRNDLQYGCDDCLRQLKQKNFYSVGAWRYDHLYTEKKEYPTSFEFQISNNCNLQCIMCNGELSNQIRKNRELSNDYQTPYNDKFIEQLIEFIPHLKQSSFTGGETFLIPTYYKIWDLMTEINPNIEVSVSTNGTILTEKVKLYLQKLRFKISISIDSVDEKIYSEIRKGAKLEKTLEHFHYFLKYSKEVGTEVNIKTCPLRQNIYHIPDLIKYFNKYDVPVVLNNVFFPPSCTLWNLPSTELNEICIYLESKIEEGKTPDQINNWMRYKNLINQISNWRYESIMREKNIDESPQESSRLLAQLKQNISAYIDTLNYHDDKEKKKLKEEFLDILSNMFEHITDEKKKIYSLKYFLHLPVDKVIGEIEFRDLSKLVHRISQISEYED